MRSRSLWKRCCFFSRQIEFTAILLAACLLASSAVLPTNAQDIPSGMSAAQLQLLQQQLGRPGAAAPEPSDQPSTTVLQPAQNPQSVPVSRLEEIMSARAGTQLRQRGYNMLGSGRAITVNQAGGIQDDYILGPGDEVVVSLRGQENNELRTLVNRQGQVVLRRQENNELRTLVNRQGQVVLQRLNPISAAGRSFASFRADVEDAVRRAYVATNAFVSIGRVRQISVLVSGEVNDPGLRTVSGLSSVVDALLLSGGIKKTGSLRNVRLQRGARQYVVDLYNLLGEQSGSAGMRLADGDRIIVPLLGPTVAIAGLVRQPAIYELPSGQNSMSVRALLALAGGEEVRGLYRLSVLKIEADGRTNMLALRDDSATIRDSEILFVQFGADQTVSRAALSGAGSLSGTFPITEGTRLSDILKAPGALGNRPYTLIGLLSRRDPRTLLRSLIAFTPVAVLRGAEDMALQDDDIVRVISVNELQVISAALEDFKKRRDAEIDAVRNPFAANGNQGTNAQSQAIQAAASASENRAAAERATAQNLTSRAPGNPGNAGSPAQGATPAQDLPDQTVPGFNYAINREVTSISQLSQQLGVDSLVLINFFLDHQITLSGSVHGPGAYLVGPNVALQDVLSAAGGPGDRTDLSSIELVSTSMDPASGRSLTQISNLPLNSGVLSSYVVRPHDEFRLKEVFSDADFGNITIQGAVRYSGSYKLKRGERLSDILSRAGGLTADAYPYGTVFLRESVRVTEQESFNRAANEIQDQLVFAMTRAGTNRLDPTVLPALQSLISDVRNQKAVGRIAVQADPSMLAARPALDPLMESGDVVYIPSRPSTVSVLGQVLKAGSFPYQAGATVEDYLQKAGGYTSAADRSQTYIVLPDGSARKVEQSWLHLTSSNLPPGSTIMVPRDISPLDLRQTIVDVTQIMSQIAISVASLAVLSKQ